MIPAGFPKVFTHLQMLEGTIQQLCNWLTCFIQFGFTNSKCNCYILMSKDRGSLRLLSYPCLCSCSHYLLLARPSQEGDKWHVLYSSVQNKEGLHKRRVSPAILGRVTLSALWSHPSPPPWQSAKHLERAYNKQQPGEMGEWRWRDPSGARNCGVTTKTELLKTETPSEKN